MVHPKERGKPFLLTKYRDRSHLPCLLFQLRAFSGVGKVQMQIVTTFLYCCILLKETAKALCLYYFLRKQSNSHRNLNDFISIFITICLWLGKVIH